MLKFSVTKGAATEVNLDLPASAEGNDLLLNLQDAGNQPAINLYEIKLTYQTPEPVKDHQVTYDYHFNGIKETKMVPDGQTAPVTKVPVREGYVFTGWYTKYAETDITTSLYDFSKPVHNNLTLHAGWQKESNYNWNMNDYSKMIKPSTTIGLPTVLNGLDVYGSLKDETTKDTFTQVDGNYFINVTASTPADGKSHKMYFNVPDGFIAESVVVNGFGKTSGGSAVVILENVKDEAIDKAELNSSLSEITLKGSKGSTFGIAFSFADAGDLAYINSITVKLKKIETNHEITFVYNDGVTKDLVKNVKDGDKVTPPKNPTRKGYQFTGWYEGFKESKGTDVDVAAMEYNFNEPVKRDAYLFAGWQKVTNQVWDMTSVAQLADDEGMEFPLPIGYVEEPTSYNGLYCIGGPSDEGSLCDVLMYGSGIGNIGILGTTTPTAHYMTFKVPNGYQLQDLKLHGYSKSGTAQISLVDAEGHVIGTANITNTTPDNIKFNIDPDMAKFAVGQLKITYSWPKESANRSEAIALDRIETINKAMTTEHTVQFIVDGEVYETQTVVDGGYATKPADPSKEGYKFNGWHVSPDAAGSGFDFENTPITEDITLYADWIKVQPVGNEHKVTFMVDGEVYKVEKVEDGHYATRPEDPTKEGYKFNGWFINPAAAGSGFDFENTPITEDTTLYADWIKESKPNPNPDPSDNSNKTGKTTKGGLATGDNVMVVLFAGLGAVAIGTAIVIGLRRKEH